MHHEITEEAIYACFAAAGQGNTPDATAVSFIDVEEYENQVMYPEFARWARKAGEPKIAELFLKVAGEEKLHATWLRSLYNEIGVPAEGEDTRRAKASLETIKANSDRLIARSPQGVVEAALKVAVRVEQREYREIYPRFRDQALAAGNQKAAEVYQRVIDSERAHAGWFTDALDGLAARAA